MPEQILTRLAETSGSIGDARTVEVIWSTGAKVKRYDWGKDGWYLEELSMEPKAIRLDRFQSGMSLLDTHDGYSMSSRIGAVVKQSVRIEGGKAYATVKFSRNQLGEQIFQDLKDGIPVQISVGYRVHKYEKTTGEEGQMPTYRAIDWEPMELSAVPIPADAGAHSRSNSISSEEPMPEELESETETRRQPVNLTIRERTRIKEIRALGKRAGLEQSVIDTAVDGGTSVESFRAAMFDELVERQSRTPTFGAQPTIGIEGNQTRVQAMADALLCRVDPSHKPKPDSGQYRGLTMLEIARECLTTNGEYAARSMSPLQVFERALHGKTDFEIVIGEIGQTVLRQRYQAVQSPLKIVANRALASTFKPKNSVQLSGFSDLEEVTEHGEYKRGSFKEGAESYRIRSYGKVFGLSFEALINDELGAFADVTRDLAAAAARLEADILAGLLNDNPVMADGRTVFDTYHLDQDGKHLPGNVVPGAALSVDALDVARLNLRQQVGLAGELVDVVPKFLVVGIENETAGERVLSAVQANQIDDINVFAGRLQLVVDRRIVGGAWYLAADPNLTPGLEYAYLAGYEGPQLAQRVGFDTDGIETRVSHRFGGGWLDFRGWVKNPGA